MFSSSMFRSHVLKNQSHLPETMNLFLVTSRMFYFLFVVVYCNTTVYFILSFWWKQVKTSTSYSVMWRMLHKLFSLELSCLCLPQDGSNPLPSTTLESYLPMSMYLFIFIRLHTIISIHLNHRPMVFLSMCVFETLFLQFFFFISVRFKPLWEHNKGTPSIDFITVLAALLSLTSVTDTVFLI